MGLAAEVSDALGDRRSPAPVGFPRESPAERDAAYVGANIAKKRELVEGGLSDADKVAQQREIDAEEKTMRKRGVTPQEYVAQAPAANSSPFAGLASSIEQALGSPKGYADVPGTAAHEEMLEQKRASESAKPSVLQRIKTAYSAGPAGPLEAGAAAVTGMVGGALGTAAGVGRQVLEGKLGSPEGAREAQARAAEIAHSLTYTPRTEAGKTIMEGLGDVAEQTGVNRLAGIGPAEGMALGALSAGPKTVFSVGRAVKQAAGMAPKAEAAGGAGLRSGGSVGAQGATLAAQAEAAVAKASPETQVAVKKLGDKITPSGLKTAERHGEAESLPVPIRLTAGQATQDVGLLSTEQNARGARPEYAKRFNEQNQQLVENIAAIREKAAPDVYVSTRPELGELVMDAYKTKDASLRKDISAKYQALQDANGGQFPLDGKSFVQAADRALHKDLAFDHVPSAVRKTMDRLAEGGTMTFEQFEALRTNLARVARSSADGNERHAASVIREALENMPLPAEAAHLKPLADAARAAAKDRFALLERDPAYKAVVNERAGADKFIEKYVVGADTAKVKTMRENLAHDSTAQQAMAAGAMDRLRAGAGLTGEGGNFSQAGYNKALESMRPKLGILFEPEARADVERLGNVARYVKGQPTGTFVNNSNTMVSLAAEAAKASVAGAANVAAHGVPIGTWARNIGGHIAKERALSRSLRPGAGVELKEVGK